MIDEKVLVERLEEHEQYEMEYGNYHASSAYGRAIEIVNQLAEEQNNGWIACSERLPKDEELSQRKEVIVQNRYGEIFTAQYTYNCPKTRKDFFKEYCVVPYVIAWQPLPQPYQPKGE